MFCLIYKMGIINNQPQQRVLWSLSRSNQQIEKKINAFS